MNDTIGLLIEVCTGYEDSSGDNFLPLVLISSFLQKLISDENVFYSFFSHTDPCHSTMMHYRKGKNVEEELTLDKVPIDNLPKELLWMKVG